MKFVREIRTTNILSTKDTPFNARDLCAVGRSGKRRKPSGDERTRPARVHAAGRPPGRSSNAMPSARADVAPGTHQHPLPAPDRPANRRHRHRGPAGPDRVLEADAFVRRGALVRPWARRRRPRQSPAAPAIGVCEPRLRPPACRRATSVPSWALAGFEQAVFDRLAVEAASQHRPGPAWSTSMSRAAARVRAQRRSAQDALGAVRESRARGCSTSARRARAPRSRASARSRARPPRVIDACRADSGTPTPEEACFALSKFDGVLRDMRFWPAGGAPGPRTAPQAPSKLARTSSGSRCASTARPTTGTSPSATTTPSRALRVLRAELRKRVAAAAARGGGPTPTATPNGLRRRLRRRLRPDPEPRGRRRARRLDHRRHRAPSPAATPTC